MIGSRCLRPSPLSNATAYCSAATSCACPLPRSLRTACLAGAEHGIDDGPTTTRARGARRVSMAGARAASSWLPAAPYAHLLAPQRRAASPRHAPLVARHDGRSRSSSRAASAGARRPAEGSRAGLHCRARGGQHAQVRPRRPERSSASSAAHEARASWLRLTGSRRWHGVIDGPRGTPYEGGHWKIECLASSCADRRALMRVQLDLRRAISVQWAALSLANAHSPAETARQRRRQSSSSPRSTTRTSPRRACCASACSSAAHVIFALGDALDKSAAQSRGLEAEYQDRPDLAQPCSAPRRAQSCVCYS